MKKGKLGERRLFNSMKKNNISTLEVHRVLSEVGIDIPKRTLQSHLDNDMRTCNDDRIEKIIKELINNKKLLIKDLKQKFAA